MSTEHFTRLAMSVKTAFCNQTLHILCIILHSEAQTISCKNKKKKHIFDWRGKF